MRLIIQLKQCHQPERYSAFSRVLALTWVVTFSIQPYLIRFWFRFFMKMSCCSHQGCRGAGWNPGPRTGVPRFFGKPGPGRGHFRPRLGKNPWIWSKTPSESKNIKFKRENLWTKHPVVMKNDFLQKKRKKNFGFFLDFFRFDRVPPMET